MKLHELKHELTLSQT